jgi:hypothetical protein
MAKRKASVFESAEAEALNREQARELHVAKAEAAELRHDLREAETAIERLEREVGILGDVGVRPGPPDWLAKPTGRKPAKKHRATPWFMLSDLHLDEVVEPEEVLGINAFNRKIARQRLELLTTNFIELTRSFGSLHYDGVVVPMLGDIFSGLIHEELKISNEDTVLGSLDFWVDPMSELFARLLEEFPRVMVPVVVGNHGRLSRKPIMKSRARDNFDWFFGRMLARVFKSERRITFMVSDSADLQVPCYEYQVMCTHMDQTRGGGGIGGIWPPIMRLDAKKRARQSAVGQPYDYMIGGHWHTLTFGPDWIINGSLKGYDEYAFLGNFGFEPPQQALFMMTPEHGKTLTAPVFCLDREAEGW